jgi:hypothetical protein
MIGGRLVVCVRLILTVVAFGLLLSCNRKIVAQSSSVTTTEIDTSLVVPGAKASVAIDLANICRPDIVFPQERKLLATATNNQATVNLFADNGKMVAECDCDSLAIYLKMRQTVETQNKIEHRESGESKPSKWQQFWDDIRAVLLIALILLCLSFIYKYLRHGKR